MKTKIYALLLLILICVCCRMETHNSDSDLISKLNEEVLKEDQIATLHNNNVVLSCNNKLVNSKGEKILLKNVVKDASLVVRYSAFSCSDCVSFVNKNILEKVGRKDNILLMLSDIPIRDLHIIKKQLGLLDVYQIDSLPLPIDGEQIPYFFILDDNYLSTSFFIPRKEMPEQTVRYLEFVKERMGQY